MRSISGGGPACLNGNGDTGHQTPKATVKMLLSIEVATVVRDLEQPKVVLGRLPYFIDINVDVRRDFGLLC